MKVKHIIRTENRNKTVTLCGEVSINEDKAPIVCLVCVEKLIDKAKTRLAIV